MKQATKRKALPTLAALLAAGMLALALAALTPLAGLSTAHAVPSGNHAQATAQEISLGGSVEGEFDVDPDDRWGHLHEYWYKFKTTNATTVYQLTGISYSGKTFRCQLYNRFGNTVGDWFSPGIATGTKWYRSLDKDAYYYIRVYENWDTIQRYGQFRISIEALDTNLANASVSLSNNWYTYDGWEKCPDVSVSLAGENLSEGSDYTVTYENNTDPGVATVTVTGKDWYLGRKTVTFRIGKAANPFTVSGTTHTIYRSWAKKHKTTFTRDNAFNLQNTSNAGKITFKKKSGNKKITVSKSGKVTVKKGLKKGTYKVKVKVTASGNKYYYGKSKTVTIKIKVKK